MINKYNLKISILKMKICLASEAHTCNPCNSGGRDQKALGSKPAWANSSRDPILKIIQHKTELEEWLEWQSKREALSSNHSTTKKNLLWLFFVQILDCIL
jgi:hypothetical protein